MRSEHLLSTNVAEPLMYLSRTQLYLVQTEKLQFLSNNFISSIYLFTMSIDYRSFALICLWLLSSLKRLYLVIQLFICMEIILVHKIANLSGYRLLNWFSSLAMYVVYS